MRPRLSRCLAAILSLSAVAICLWAPLSAQAEQAGSRSHAFLAGRMDSGGLQTCAIAGNGTLRCWGYAENYGALGYANTNNIGDDETPASVGPVDLGAGRSAVTVSTGDFYSCAILDNGTVRCWGFNGYGQLGRANTTNIGDNETPGSVGPMDLGAGRTATAISAGETHSCAILDNGTVRCWGAGFGGQLGYGNTTTIGDDETPGSVGPVDLGVGRTATAISAGGTHTCAILDNGTVRCWGFGAFKALGYGNTTSIGDNETPGSVGPVDLGAGRTAVAISAGGSHTCAILDNGTVKCWGSGADGRLGYGNTSDVLNPATVGTVDLGAGRTAVAISAVDNHTCAQLDNDSLLCWGENDYGQLGYGNRRNIGDDETPASAGPVDLGAGRNAVGITAGRYFSCAQLDNGTVRCWGEAGYGQLGYGNKVRIGEDETPALAGPVDLGTGHGALETATGASHSCALFDTGTVRCWGLGTSGQLGYANTTTIGDNENVGVAGTVDLGGRSAVEIVAGEAHTCALLDVGTVRCWGKGANGQLGSANTANIGDNETPGSVPPVNLGGEEAVAITAGANHTCALLADGTLRCWGLGASGQLGYVNTTTIGDNETPASAGAVNVGRSATAITAGANHTCARLDDGTLRCWGLAASGQLGYGNMFNIGDNETPSSAGAVNVGRSTTAITGGANHTCARLDDGTLRCWGLGASGRLGYANTTTIGDNETPASAGAVNVGRSATAITAGGNHSCARLDDSTVRCWGLGASGQLGYGNANAIGDDEAPTLAGAVNLGAGRSAVDVSAGESHTCAALDNGTVRCWGLNTFGQLGYGNTITIGDNETPGSAGPVDFVDPPVVINGSATLPQNGSATPTDVHAKSDDPCLDAGAPGGQGLSAAFKRNRRRQITVAFGAGAIVEGQLTDASGQPLAGASMCVETQILDQRDSVSLVAGPRTDASGHFSYLLPPGPSRAVTVIYRDGARQLKRRLLYFARARPSLHASPLHLHNGQLVHFQGRLPRPGAGGCVVILQATAAGSKRWITFQRATTNGHGAFRSGYHFTSTSHRTRYRFRAVVPRQTGYPWAEGHSKAVNVTVNP